MPQTRTSSLRFHGLAGVVSILLVSSAALGFGGRTRSAPPYYAWPVATVWPASVYPAWVCQPFSVTPPGIVPLTPARPIPFAPPRPAPPSETKEPPIGKSTSHSNQEAKGPTIVESRGAAPAPVAKDRCKVGFWNLLGRDVEVKVGGKSHTLPKDRAITLELERHFTWSLPGRADAQERVPDDQAFFEIILRKE